MKNRRIIIAVISLCLAFLMAASLTACGGNKGGAEEKEPAEQVEQEEEQEPESALSEEEMDSLMKQVAESELDRRFKQYVPDEVFACAEVFGTDMENKDGTMYAYLYEGEYVEIKGKAYEVTGAAGEVIIRFIMMDDGPELETVEWSADGGEHEGWLLENYPPEYLEKATAYNASDEDGNMYLSSTLADIAEEEMGVPVERENILEIDDESGKYFISKVIESGDPEEGTYQFDTEVLDKGKLKDLKK